MQRFATYFGLAFLFALLLSSCRGGNIYVSNTAEFDGAPNGSATRPYPTISEALADTSDGSKHVINVKDSPHPYNENIELPVSITINRWQDAGDVLPARIIGAPDRPTITARGDNSIGGLIIEGGSHGVMADLRGHLGAEQKSYIYVLDCEIRGVSSPNHAGHGIEVMADMREGRSLTGDKRVYLLLNRNYIHDIENGNGISLSLTGVDTGPDRVERQALSLAVSENVITGVENGISVSIQGVDTIDKPRVVVDNSITDNLIVSNDESGIDLESTHGAFNYLLVSYNTLANNGGDGVYASATDGGLTAVSFTGNLVAQNDGYGYREATTLSQVSGRHNNLFYGNAAGQYFDFDAGMSRDTEEVLNAPDVGLTAGGNLVADPRFVNGTFYWMGESYVDDPAEYFLSQEGPASPAIDAGDANANARGNSERASWLSNRTTCVDGLANDLPIRRDTGTADIGFHYAASRD